MAERATVKGYDVSDVEAVYRYVNPTNWNELIDWLKGEEQGPGQAKRITAEEARALRADCERLQQQGQAFPATADEFWRMAQGK
jgi:hypothetical protein